MAMKNHKKGLAMYRQVCYIIVQGKKQELLNYYVMSYMNNLIKRGV